MAERKRWDKQQPQDGEAKADPVLAKQLKYIKVLEERNRVKKRLAAASKRSDRLQEREEAFVTAFNVPARAASASTSSARSARSATSVLPSKLAGKRDQAKLVKCWSAPSTTLNFGPSSAAGEEEKESRARRPRWNRPQAPMGVAVDHLDGVPLFRLTTYEEAKSERKSGDEEESYLEESFEEFEEDEDERDSADSGRTMREELVIDAIDKVDDDVKPTAAERGDFKSDALGSPVDFSKTTKELVGIIQHLSRAKQRALVDVLQKFQASEQEERDVRVLQSSIGDPAIWKEITSTLASGADNVLPAEEKVGVSTSGAAVSRNPEVPTVVPLKKLLEEQLQWEDQCANEMKERLEREREEKQRILKKSEERRASMMKQLEDEEREIERLMEVKRQERIAKLRALQEETADAGATLIALGSRTTSDGVGSVRADSDYKAVKRNITSKSDKQQYEHACFALNDNLHSADTKGKFDAGSHIKEKKSIPTNVPDSKSQQDLLSIVPKLNLSFDASDMTAVIPPRYEIQVKLLSTWSKTRAVGLTQICVYDQNGEELSVNSESVQLFDQPTGNSLPRTNDMVRGLMKLFNGVAQTNVEKDMWLGRLGDSGTLNSESVDYRSDVSEKFQWVQPNRLQKRAESEPERLADKSSESTPLWLAGSSYTPATSNRSAVTSRFTPNLDTWMADEKPSSGSVTSRRRQGKPAHDVNDDKPRHQQNLVVPSLCSLSSWDSLEKFSKTNRSRLPQPTETIENINNSLKVDSTLELVDAEPKLTTRTPFTTSALLTELRQGSLAAEPLADSETPIRLSLSNYVDTTQCTTKDLVKASILTSADIPVLPNGTWLQIEILSTWGDSYYVGLNGVEIFDHRGELVKFHDPAKQVTACPESINVLEENSDDPRVPKNLVDGVNFTCDDFHMWLAPFTPGHAHYVLIEMTASVSVSMIRIWNYNKSRTHTCRGVREARLILYDSAPRALIRGSERKLADSSGSGKIIFEGEIRQAPGLVRAESMDISNEVILFTQEETILEAIETNDEALRALANEQHREDEEARDIVALAHQSMELQRPRTSDAGSRLVEQNQAIDSDNRRQVHVNNVERPMTMANRSISSRDTALRASIDSWMIEEPQQRSPDAVKMNEGISGRGVSGSEENLGAKLPRGRRLTLQLHGTWGDRNYVGLTQVSVLVGSRGTPIPLDASNVDATPRDLSSVGLIEIVLTTF
ncbi:unnamed protein product [Phytophthora fragariaefolia]|uniref:Unnamed protein product n=1 Tax=Phytophthora fragariaefolia TaxID=1490495 RepID=A0A9W7CFW3_9STRA|nr:unnamed protein product [Phytophthora fragariaefolia]